MRVSRILLIVLLPLGMLQAQLNTFLYLNQAFESNPFRYPDAEESWVSTLEGGIQYDLSSLAASYNGSYTNFSNFNERNYYWHQASIFGAFGNTRLGVYYDQRFNQGDYDIYNYNALTAYLNHFLPIKSFNLYFAANGIINKYAELEDINNFELNSSMRLNKSFETRTTFIAGIGWHYKKYTTDYSYTDTVTTGSGTGMGQNSTGTSQTFLQSIEVEAPSVSQLQYWIRLAQSVSSSTGLATQYRARINLKGDSRYVAGLDYNYNGESEIFDDPMGYELQSLGAELTQILPAQIIIKASAYSGKKNYTVQGIYTDPEWFDETILRSDSYQTAHINISKNFSFNQTRLAVQLWYRWIKNESNSYWYNYTNHYGSIALNFSF